MYKPSLRECRVAINADAISWQSGDGSLSVSGGKDAVTLTFVPEVPVVAPKRIRLTGAELVTFKSALEELAE
jgi:hypothetical protein